MPVDNFDDKIKNQLEKREINPSARAWDQLSAQLEVKEEKSTKKYWWLGIAASFLGGILLTTLLTHNNSSLVRNPIVVKDTLLNTQKTQIVVKDTEVIEDTKNIELDTKLSVELKSPEQLVENVGVRENKEVRKNIAIAKVAASSKDNHTEENQELFVYQKIDNKAQAVVDQVKELSVNREVTEEEIDELIRKAQLEIRTQEIFSDNKNKVSAQALLQNVEQELDQSFRERIFNAIENGFGQVKSTITFLGR